MSIIDKTGSGRFTYPQTGSRMALPLSLRSSCSIGRQSSCCKLVCQATILARIAQKLLFRRDLCKVYVRADPLTYTSAGLYFVVGQNCVIKIKSLFLWELNDG